MSEVLAPPARPRPGIALAPHVAARVPPAARRKLGTISEALELANDTALAAVRRQMTAGDDRRRAEGRLQLLLEHTGHRDPAALAAARADVEAADALEVRRGILAEEASAAAGPLQTLAQRLSDYLEAHADKIAEAPPITPKATKEAPAVQLHSVRLAIAGKQAAAATMRAAPPTDAEIGEAMRSAVAALALNGAPFIADGGEITWRNTTAVVGDGGREFTGKAVIPDAIAFQAWLNPEAMTARLIEQALNQRRGAPGLPRAEREAKLARLEIEILDLERQEEAIVEAGGFARRGDADVRAILGLAGPKPVA